MRDVLLSAAGVLLSSGDVNRGNQGLLLPYFLPRAFEVLSDGSVQTSSFTIERKVIDSGSLTDDPHHYTSYETFRERSLRIMLFLDEHPREVTHSDPRGVYPIELTLAHVLVESTGIAHFGWDGASAFLKEVEELESEVLGYATFTARPAPPPVPAVGTIGLACLGGLLSLLSRWRLRG